jgi:hypothetical protein
LLGCCGLFAANEFSIRIGLVGNGGGVFGRVMEFKSCYSVSSCGRDARFSSRKNSLLPEALESTTTWKDPANDNFASILLAKHVGTEVIRQIELGLKAGNPQPQRVAGRGLFAGVSRSTQARRTILPSGTSGHLYPRITDRIAELTNHRSRSTV